MKSRRRAYDTQARRLAALVDDAKRLKDTQADEALRLSVRARRLARTLGDERALAAATLHAAGSAYRQSRYRMAAAYTEEAEQLFRQQGDHAGMGSTANMRGLLRDQCGDLAGAYTCFHTSLRLGREAGIPGIESVALGNLALVARLLGDVPTALEWALAGLEHARTHQNVESETRILVNMTILYHTMQQMDAARSCAERALEQARRLKLPGLLTAAHAACAEVHLSDGDPLAALASARESLRLAEALHDQHKVMRAQEQVAMILLTLGKAAEARTLLLAGLEAARRLGDAAAAVKLGVRLGTTLAHLGEAGVAREVLLEAQTQGEQHGCRVEVVEALLARSELEKRLGDYPQALALYEAYHQEDKRVFGETQSRRAQALLVTHEVREIRRLNEELQARAAELDWAASHDTLTGALNRRAFLVQATEELTRVQRSGGRARFAVALLDVDHFKGVNDRFGHDVGDEVLRALVTLTQSAVRDDDVLCRWGGEEFMLLLPHTDASGGNVVCERLRRTVEAHPWHTLHPALAVTVSIGLAAWHAHVTLDPLIKEADGALYQAKSSGRNRVTASVPGRSVV